MERRTQQARQFIAGEAARGVFAGMRSVGLRVRHACGVRWAWRITAGPAVIRQAHRGAGLCHAFP